MTARSGGARGSVRGSQPLSRRCRLCDPRGLRLPLRRKLKNSEELSGARRRCSRRGRRQRYGIAPLSLFHGTFHGQPGARCSRGLTPRARDLASTNQMRARPSRRAPRRLHSWSPLRPASCTLRRLDLEIDEAHAVAVALQRPGADLLDAEVAGQQSPAARRPPRGLQRRVWRISALTLPPPTERMLACETPPTTPASRRSPQPTRTAPVVASSRTMSARSSHAVTSASRIAAERIPALRTASSTAGRYSSQSIPPTGSPS